MDNRNPDNLVNPVKKEIDVLFGTDCISEGQNLQDCVVNYDIHWNPVRVIQRFGRVDRIGTKNASVKLVNFWPDIDLNEYIDLTDRVKNRMQAVNIAGIVLQALRGGGRRHDDITGRIAARAGGAALPP